MSKDESLTHLIDLASRQGNLHLLQEACSQGADISEEVIANIIIGNHVLCLEYILYKCFIITSSSVRLAAKCGHLSCLKLLLAYNPRDYPRSPYKQTVFYWDYFITITAARHGQLDCLVYAYEQGVELNYEATAQALRYNHLDCLKFCMDKLGDEAFKSYYVYCWNLNLNEGKCRSILFDANLTNIPALKKAIDCKKQQIKEYKQACYEILNREIHSDIIKFIIWPYI